MIQEITVNVDGKLSVDKFTVDELNAHIALVDDPDIREFDKLILCCPAGLYKRNPEGETSFDYAGCLECGTCRMLCQDTVLRKWEYPQAGCGVAYRFG